MKSRPYEAQAVPMKRDVLACPAASRPGTFFFQRVCMMCLTVPAGLTVVMAPHGVMPDVWMSVLAYDSLSYRMTRQLYSVCCSAAEIADSPMSPPPPSPQKAMTLIFSSLILPLRICDCSPAAAPMAAEPAAPSWVCIHGMTHGVV